MRRFLLVPIVLILACCSCDIPEQKRTGDTSSGSSAETKQISSSEPTVSEEQEKQQIIQCFTNYKSAILNDRGTEAVRYSDKNTIDYYAQVLQWVLTASREEGERLSILDKMQVLIMRLRVPAEQLRTMTAEELLVYSIDQGMVGKNGAATLDPGTVTVDGNFGKMTILSNQKDTGMSYHYNKENGEWKMDLTAVFPQTRVALEAMAKQNDMSENSFIFTLIGTTSPIQPTDDLWVPIGK